MPNHTQVISDIFSRNQITPSIALTELKPVQQRVTAVNQALSQLLPALHELKIGKEVLEPGQSELGILIPRRFVHNKLDEFGKELTELNKMFGVFSELVTGSREAFPVRGISSTDLSVFLGLLPQVAVCIFIGLDKILDVYKKILEIKAKRIELGNLGLPDELLEKMDAHAREMVNTAIEDAADKILEAAPARTEAGRKNELRSEVKVSLNKIANRIDSGVNIEIRVSNEDPRKEEEKTPDVQEGLKFLRENTTRLQFVKGEGPPILHLPESKSEGRKRAGKDDKEKDKP
jgi:hypothetical protein